MIYTEETVAAMRAEIPTFLSGKRLAHTYAVAEECAALAALFSAHPTLFSREDGLRLQIAALCHDITKEKSYEEQCALCQSYRIPLTDMERTSPKVLHAKTAACLAKAYFNETYNQNLIDDAIADAIWTHTTGSARMSLMGKLLYLADYIEKTRTFPDCVTLRQRFYEGLEPVKDDPRALCRHLDDILILSFDLTIRGLIEDGACIDVQTTAARNALLYEKTESR